MEEFAPQETPQEIKLVVSEEMRSYLYDTTKWARFLAIIGFVLSVFLFLGAFGAGAVLSSSPEVAKQLGPLAQFGSLGITFFYVLLGLIYLYPSLLLFRFSTRARLGVLYGDQESLNASLLNMKSLFKFFGILTVVAIISYFLMIAALMPAMMK